REVAVKMLRGDLDEQFTEEYRQRFLREARAVGRLSHPAIVTIYDVGEDKEHENAFIAMEYLEGTTLKKVMAGGTSYDADRAVHLTATLAEALNHAHQLRVVHRDVKPANIILTADGKVKLTDFGIARLETSDLTVEGSFIGTPNYMSPEQIHGNPADKRSDLYSLGVILFELVTGRRPFAGKSLPELSINITTQPIPDPASLCPGLPRSLSQIIMRCLAKDPADRFQSGGDLAQALRGIEPVEDLVPAAAAQGEGLVDVAPKATHEPLPSSPVPPDLTATRVSDMETIADGSNARLMLHRWSVAAAPFVRARWFWPVVASAVLLTVTVAGLYIAGFDDEPKENVTSDLSSGRAGGGVDSESRMGSGDTEPKPPVSPVQPQSTLVVSHKNRMSLAFISLWIDGTKAWSQRMTAEKNVLKRFKRISGVQIDQNIAIPEGPHLIEVHISGKSMKVESSASIEGIFRAGGTRYLKVTLNPYTDKMKLEWTD
ncbi:MAG: serine/threonine-protein kinase, partial [Acidobacteriota bacterium]